MSLFYNGQMECLNHSYTLYLSLILFSLKHYIYEIMVDIERRLFLRSYRIKMSEHYHQKD